MGDGYAFLLPGVFAENLYIVRNQFHGIYRVSLTRQCMGVPAGSGTNLQYPVAGFYIFVDLMHCGEKLNRAVF